MLSSLWGMAYEVICRAPYRKHRTRRGMKYDEDQSKGKEVSHKMLLGNYVISDWPCHRQYFLHYPRNISGQN